jgi:hypothetical protein
MGDWRYSSKHPQSQQYMEVGSQLDGPDLVGEESPDTHWIGGWVGIGLVPML